MNRNIDLHIHSSISEDGDYSVEELFKLARDASLSAISITDHDSVESISSAQSVLAEYDIQYVPGVEITTVFSIDGSQQHILGYFVDDKNEGLIDVLNSIAGFRGEIARKRISALREIGFKLDEKRIFENIQGRPPTASSIVMEIFENRENFNDKRLLDYFFGDKKDNRLLPFYREFLSAGKPAYVEFESISVEEGINIIKKSGGIPVLAHPRFLKERKWLKDMMKYGIQGIEAISTYHSRDDNRFFIDFARNNSLLITPGSDFHGPSAKPLVKIGGIEGNDYSYYTELKRFYENR